jgi:hypothetical protein
VTAISLHWSAPLISGGVCMLIFPLWMFAAPGAGSPFAAGWQLGLNVLLYYPPVAAGSSSSRAFTAGRVEKRRGRGST